jgi:hypothetical protein
LAGVFTAHERRGGIVSTANQSAIRPGYVFSGISTTKRTVVPMQDTPFKSFLLLEHVMSALDGISETRPSHKSDRFRMRKGAGAGSAFFQRNPFPV